MNWDCLLFIYRRGRLGIIVARRCWKEDWVTGRVLRCWRCRGSQKYCWRTFLFGISGESSVNMPILPGPTNASGIRIPERGYLLLSWRSSERVRERSTPLSWSRMQYLQRGVGRWAACPAGRSVLWNFCQLLGNGVLTSIAQHHDLQLVDDIRSQLTLHSIIIDSILSSKCRCILWRNSLRIFTIRGYGSWLLRIRI